MAPTRQGSPLGTEPVPATHRVVSKKQTPSGCPHSNRVGRSRNGKGGCLQGRRGPQRQRGHVVGGRKGGKDGKRARPHRNARGRTRAAQARRTAWRSRRTASRERVPPAAAGVGPLDSVGGGGQRQPFPDLSTLPVGGCARARLRCSSRAACKPRSGHKQLRWLATTPPHCTPSGSDTASR